MHTCTTAARVALGAVLAAACAPPNDSDDVFGTAVVTPCDLDFGIVDPGGVADRTVDVRNTGPGPLTVSEIRTAPPF